MQMEELKRLAIELKRARLLVAAGRMIASYAERDQQDVERQLTKALGPEDARIFVDILDGAEMSAEDAATSMGRAGWSAARATFLKVVEGG